MRLNCWAIRRLNITRMRNSFWHELLRQGAERHGVEQLSYMRQAEEATHGATAGPAAGGRWAAPYSKAPAPPALQGGGRPAIPSIPARGHTYEVVRTLGCTRCGLLSLRR